MKSPDYPCVLLSRDGSVVSKLVQWVTDGKASHVRLYFPFPGAGVWEACPLHGVRFTQFNDWDHVEVYRPLSYVNWGQVLKFCRGEDGKGYDWLADLRFLTHTNRPDVPTRWNCSGFVHEALRAGGIELVARVPFWKISPESLRRSPLLYGPIWK